MRRRFLTGLILSTLACSGDKDNSETGIDTQSLASVDADFDGFDESEDCDDNNPEIYPGSVEICDEVDNDCDDEIDEADALDAPTWYLDSDSDGYGDELDSVRQCSAPSGYVAENKAGFDCDDGDAAFHPGADESDCTDPNDYNCDGSVAYADADADGWAACEECDDSDAAIHPDAVEICDELDNDCDSLIDDADDDLALASASDWYRDADADGFGLEEDSQRACLAPSGYVAESAEGYDCNDENDAFYPGADESDCADPNDYNCDGSVAYADADGDGWAACEECNDSDPRVNPDAVEICNEVDDDCDGDVDDDDSGVTGTTTWYIDYDGDGFGSDEFTQDACDQSEGWVEDSDDCDDSDDAIHPGADEVCNELDDDCDDRIDDADPGLDSSTAETWYADLDGDGFGDPSAVSQSCAAGADQVADNTDCDDGDQDIHPDATEACNGWDDDCDGAIDDDDVGVTGTSTWYIDYDSDGYGSDAYIEMACAAPAGWVADDTDCDDTDALLNPGADEVCNEIDDDCDGDVDEADSDLIDGTTWYADSDSDGYGDPSLAMLACDVPSGSVTDGTDCDDSDWAINPDAVEVCNGVDDDCDADIDDYDVDVTGTSTWYADTDGDGYGDSATSTAACVAPMGYVSDATDCYDGDSAIYPGGTEICDDGWDNDCDGVDESCSTCGDGTLDSGEEYDPAPGPYSYVSVDSSTCRWDFSSVNQLYCNGGCTWAGGSSCDQSDADILCQLITDNPASTAISWTATTALSEPGFSCPGYGTSIYTDRGVSTTVWYQDSSIRANHGAGDVVAYPNCTNP